MPRGGMPGPELLADGLPVVAPAVPHRSLLGDAAHVASVIRQIDGPVILVGHSYGGAVITVAGIEPNVRALVYLSAYALEEGESLGELQGRFPDSPLAAGLIYQTFPIEGSDQPGTDVYVDVAKFPGIFAADVDPELARVLAVGQRPLAGVAFNPDVERFGYQRAGMTTIEIASSRLVMLSHPREVADLIRAAIADLKRTFT